MCFFLGDLKIPFKSPQSPKRERQGDWRRKRGWRGQTLTCVCAVPCIGWTEQLRCREHFACAPCNIRVLLRRHLQQHERTEGYWQRPHLPMALSYARQGKRVGANTLRALPSPRGMACALFILSLAHSLALFCTHARTHTPHSSLTQHTQAHAHTHPPTRTQHTQAQAHAHPPTHLLP